MRTLSGYNAIMTSSTTNAPRQSAWFKPKNLLDTVFEISVVIKGIEGLFELAAGLVLLVLGSGLISNLAKRLTYGELREEPHNIIASFVLHSGQQLASGGTTYLVLYLLIHALIKFVVVFGLLRNKMWSYPFSLVTLGIFMIYQFYQIYLSHSVVISILTLYDIFLLWLIWREYQSKRSSAQV